MCQNNYPGLGAVVCGLKNESETIDIDLLELLKDNELGVRCVSFKLSTKEVIANAIRTIDWRKKQLWFKVLKGAPVEDEVEYEGEKGTIKEVLQQAEANQRWIFAGIEKGIGKHNNDELVIMNEDLIEIGSK